MSQSRAAPARRLAPGAAAAFVKSGMWLDDGAVPNQPDVFAQALPRRAGELSGVKIRVCLSVKPRAVLAAAPEGAHGDHRGDGRPARAKALIGRARTPGRERLTQAR